MYGRHLLQLMLFSKLKCPQLRTLYGVVAVIPRIRRSILIQNAVVSSFSPFLIVFIVPIILIVLIVFSPHCPVQFHLTLHPLP
jgi:hypothetical protein